MKKLIACLAALFLALSALPAGAAGEAGPDLYEIARRTESGREWTGNAVPILEGVALAAPSAMPEDPEDTVVWDGTAWQAVGAELPAAGGRLRVILCGASGGGAGIPAYSLAEAGRAVDPGALIVRSGDWMQSRINRAVYDAVPLEWQGLDCLLLTLSGDTESGAAVVTEDGILEGIVIAQYAEGLHRYLALSARGIGTALLEASEQLTAASDTRPEGYTVTLSDGNLAVFDWSAAELPEAGEGEKVYHIVADTGNSFLSYQEVTPGLTRAVQMLTPGRTYVSGLAVFAGPPDDLPEEYALTVMPEAEPLSDYSFESLVFAIALPSEDGTRAEPVPEAEITEALLRGGKACLLSATSYTVEGAVPDAPLLITLTAPDGNNYRYESGWSYMQEIMARDEWFVPLSDTGLLEMLDRDGYPEGTYEAAMYIGGKLADSFRFELKP